MVSVAQRAAPNGGIQIHASTVVIDGRAVVLMGPSGVGKSDLAFGLIGLGAGLLADDVTWLHGGASLRASCPPSLSGQIEARGVGILHIPPVDPAPVGLIVDLGQLETERVPPQRRINLLDHAVPLLHKIDSPHFAEMILVYMRYGRVA